MKHIFFTLVFLLTSLSFAFVFKTKTFACSCIIPGTTIEELEKSENVFRAKVESIEEDSAEGRQYKVNLSVSETFKGNVEPIIAVYTPMDAGAGCGYTFVDDSEYLLFTTVDETGKNYVYSCSVSKLASEATVELDTLRAYVASYGVTVNEPPISETEEELPEDTEESKEEVSESEKTVRLLLGISGVLNVLFLFLIAALITKKQPGK